MALRSTQKTSMVKKRFVQEVFQFLVVVLLSISGVDAVAAQKSSARRTRRLPDAAVPINLYELLGPDAYARGVIWQPMKCYAPTSQRMDNGTEARLDRLEDMMSQDLLEALSETTNVPITSLSRQSSFPSVSVGPSLDQGRLETDLVYRKHALRAVSSDERYWRWLRRMSQVILSYTADNRDPATGKVPMACYNKTIADVIGKVSPDRAVNCSNVSSIVEHWGFFNDPALRIENVLQRVLRDPGWCSVRPMYEPYGRWLKRERMMSKRPGDQRFRFDNRHKDRVVFLFDILYESESAFKRQHWLGAVVQQNPFDMYAIMDLIHTLEPDLIIETGTANGGSALMWASMLQLTRPGSGRVITIDVNEPVKESWAGVSTKDPTQNPMWKQYVTFLKGSSLDPRVLSMVREAAAAAKVVLVLLDSDHTEHHVQLEAQAYCPLVTVGSYCIIEDTKLSRFSAVGGPIPGIQRFLERHLDFIADRDREPFYTQHVGGYLRRTQVSNGTQNKGAARN
ncbi:hypothetical protein Vretifemale_11986 [Volvox reticuliferus]|uniref:Rhamnosyl O-methyltransferase n=1 Tax=Volvox reticuliferus TaxID=1737510 RepID=A0A8J4FP43_9CHLO|nr:hypothetical protein Vretifemale_11986 [Volvox reticuliferus]